MCVCVSVWVCEYYVCLVLVYFVTEYVWHKALLMKYTIRLEFTRVCSLNGFRLGMSLYRGHSSLFTLPALPLIGL